MPIILGGVEVQGIILVAALLFGLLYVIPYLYRRRRILGDARLDERYADNLRMLVAPEEPSINEGQAHGSVLPGTSEAKMEDENGTRMTVRMLARERARRRARITKREANRTRGYVAAGILGGVAVMAWILQAATALPMAVALVATVLFAVVAGGVFYLALEMAKATEADLEAIDELNDQLAQARKASREVTRRQRPQRAVARTAHDAAEDQGPQAGDYARDSQVRAGASAADAPSDAGLSFSMDDTIRLSEDSQPTPSRDRPRREVAPVVESAVKGRAGAPSYTLKPAIVQRDIAPYEPPAADVAPVPFRPTSLGERLADPTDAPAGGVALTPESAEALAGGSALDALLDRRRA